MVKACLNFKAFLRYTWGWWPFFCVCVCASLVATFATSTWHFENLSLVLIAYYVYLHYLSMYTYWVYLHFVPLSVNKMLFAILSATLCMKSYVFHRPTSHLEHWTWSQCIFYKPPESWTSKTVLCAGLNAFVVCVYIWWYFYQLTRIHEELIKCVKESLHTEICCEETAVLPSILNCNGQHCSCDEKSQVCLGILSFIASFILWHHIVFLIFFFDVFGLCCIHMSVEPHQNSFLGPLVGAHQGSDAFK